MSSTHVVSLLVVLFSLGAVLPPGLRAERWTGAGGSLAWSDPNNWAPPTLPGPNSVVYVDHEVVLDIDTTIGVLFLLPASSGNSIGGISPFGGRDLTISAGILNNNGGIFRLNASGILLRPNGLSEAFLNGNAQIFMQDSSANVLRASSGVIYHGTGHTIVGSGKLLGNTCGMVNEGTILAAATVLTNGLGELVMSNALVIDPGGTNNTFVNNGVLEAWGAAGLVLQAGIYEMGTNIVRIFGGSALSLRSGAVLRGGIYLSLTNPPPPLPGVRIIGLAALGQGAGLSEGVIQPYDNAVLEGVTFEGHVVQENNRWPVIRGGLTNNGLWSINGAGASTKLRYDGSQGIWGNGRIVMSDSPNNRIVPVQVGEVLTNGPNHTIQGAGNLLGDSGGGVNLGTIQATRTASPLVVDPDNQGFVNEGFLQALGDAGLTLLAGPCTNRGNIVVAPMSSLNRTGDFIQTAGETRVNGSFSTTGWFQLQGGRLDGNGVVSALSNSGGQVAPGASAGQLHVDGDYTQSGAGELVIEIGGLAPGTEHDQLTVTGAADLGGNLTVTLINGFVPNVGDQFTVLTATGQVTGTFAQGSAVQTGGQVFRVGYTDHEVILTYTGAGGETFGSWQLTHFPNDLDKPEISGFDADPDGDGVPNGFEFAGGADPNNPGDVPRIAAGVEGDRFVAEFVRNPHALGVQISAEASPTVVPWAADPALLQGSPEVVDNGDATETLRFLSTKTVSDRPVLFIRFVATEVP